MALADIGGFGQGWLQGQQTALSNYANIAKFQLMQQEQERARQAQNLQTLIHGTSLAQTAPDVAERAAQDPDRYGLSPETIGPAAAQARASRSAEARLNHAILTGNIDEISGDAEVGHLLAAKPKEYLPLIKEAADRRRVNTILQDPNMTPEQKATALYGMGQKGVNLTDVFPSLTENAEAAKSRGGLRGQQGLVGQVETEKAVGKGTGELVTAGPLSQAKRQGEYEADLAPGKSGLPGQTQTGQRAIQNETPAQREYRTTHNPPGEIKPTDVSNALNRNRVQARQEVSMALGHAKPVFDALPPNQQSEIIEYYTLLKQRQLMSQDPVLANQAPVQVPPKPKSVLEFEGQAQTQGWGDWIKSLFGGGSSAAPEAPSAPAESATPTRTLRNPEQAPAAGAIPAPPGLVNAQGVPAREGDTVRNKKTGQEYTLQNGMLVPK